MEPEIPEPQVKVISPEKELPPPEFQPTPLQISEAVPTEAQEPGIEPKQEPGVQGISPDAEQAVGAVIDEFGKLIDDYRSTRDVNLNEPSVPYPIGQQIYEQRQQFFDEFDSAPTVYPFQVSLRGNKFFIRPGYVRCYYQGPSYLDVVPAGMDPVKGVEIPKNGTSAYVQVIVATATVGNPTQVAFAESISLISGTDLESSYPTFYIKLATANNQGQVFNYVNSVLKFEVCGYFGQFYFLHG